MVAKSKEYRVVTCACTYSIGKLTSFKSLIKVGFKDETVVDRQIYKIIFLDNLYAYMH